MSGYSLHTCHRYAYSIMQANTGTIMPTANDDNLDFFRKTAKTHRSFLLRVVMGEIEDSDQKCSPDSSFPEISDL